MFVRLSAAVQVIRPGPGEAHILGDDGTCTCHHGAALKMSRVCRASARELLGRPSVASHAVGMCACQYTYSILSLRRHERDR